MKKSLVLISCIVIISFVSCRQTICYACKPKGYNDFIEQLSSQSGVFEIRDNWDLSIDKIKVKCSKQITIGGNLYYYSNKSVKLKAGQVIIIPKGCVFLSNTLNRILGEGIYETNSNIICYLASSDRCSETCFVTKRIVLPPNYKLRFLDGTIKNGVIDMAGGLIEAPSTQILQNCIVTNWGNKKIYGRWFLSDKQSVTSEDFNCFVKAEVDFDGLSLYAKEVISVSNAHWSKLRLTAPQIIIGNPNQLVSDFPIWKKVSKEGSYIETNVDLSVYKDYIILLSFAEPVYYDWREKNGRPSLYRGLTSIISSAKSGSFGIEDSVEVFGKDYIYKASDGTQTLLKSRGFIYEPCHVTLDSCTFYSSGRIDPGFMYIYSGKDIFISNCSWIASTDGTPSLLGINNSVNGVVKGCLFKGAYYHGTNTSYGLQTFNSTRITIKECTLEGNRRGVDFSGGLCQSRYCVVEDCKVVGRIIEHEGSGLGGHSTSYRNIFRNNIIEGSSSCIGIQTRGEYEIIEGNHFHVPFSAAAITCVENTTIRNNECVDGNTSTFVWLESISIDGNNILVENNRFTGNYLVRGQKELTCNVTINGNTFRYVSPTSSFAPVGNNVTVRSVNNKLIKENEKAVLYFKYNNTNKQAVPESLGKRDKVEFRFSKNGKLLE